MVKKVMLIGNAPSANKLMDMDLSEYVTVGVNHIDKMEGFTPTFHCVSDIAAYFEKTGWDRLATEETTWIFPKRSMEAWTHIPDNVEVVFVDPRWYTNNTTFDLGLPTALVEMQRLNLTDLYVIGIGGKGYFYDLDGTNESNARVHTDVYDILKEGLGVNVIDLA